MLGNLDNEVIFKKAFTDKLVLTTFVHDVLGIDVEFDKIETEKQFGPKIGDIDIKLDIFAESKDKRVVVELQRIQYDYNFDRFLHYFMAAIIEIQKSAKKYQIDQTVYLIVVMTEPYSYLDKRGYPVRDEVLLMNLNPRTLMGEERAIYGHQLMLLNPNHPEESTPQATRDWLDLVYQSIHTPTRSTLNKGNKGIERAIELITLEHLSSAELTALKDEESMQAKAFRREHTAIQKAKTATVLRMNEDNLPIALIAKYVELSEKEVEDIIAWSKLSKEERRER